MSEPAQAAAVIVGAGQAGCELALALRQAQFAGRIVLIGDEPYLPYRRPPLSKTFLSGEASLESLFIKSPDTFRKLEIECLTGVRVDRIERDAHTVTFGDGSALRYGKLALTTGGRPRAIDVPGVHASNVHYVRGIADITSLREQFVAGRRLVMIGGGFIGLEIAATATQCGLHVTVIEALPRVLARVTAPEVSAFYEQVHRDHGVDIRTGTGVQAFVGERLAHAVLLTDGSEMPADLIVIGVGMVPNTELATAAGLEVSNGIVVDEHAQTADADIVAAGDCTWHANAFLGRHVRLESVPNALEQSRVAAASMCGKRIVSTAVPWFWSDQYDIKLQMVGLSQGYDTLLFRGDLQQRSFCACYLKDGVLLAIDAVNRPQEFMVGKRLVAARVAVDAAVVCDDDTPLKTLLPAAP